LLLAAGLSALLTTLLAGLLLALLLLTGLLPLLLSALAALLVLLATLILVALVLLCHFTFPQYWLELITNRAPAFNVPHCRINSSLQREVSFDMCRGFSSGAHRTTIECAHALRLPSYMVEVRRTPHKPVRSIQLPPQLLQKRLTRCAFLRARLLTIARSAIQHIYALTIQYIYSQTKEVTLSDVLRFARNNLFEPHELKALEVAYLNACAATGVERQSQALKEQVARRIMAIALAGERDPINIYVHYLRHLGPLAPAARM
jgi:hypothetical protein